MSNEPFQLSASVREPDRADTLLAALADEPARQVVAYVQKSEDQIASLEGLVDHLVDSKSPSENREQLAIRLHHVTLPKLADAGIIEYDARSHTVRYRDTRLSERVSAVITAWRKDS